MEAETQSDGWRGKIARDEKGWIESEGSNEEEWKGDSVRKRDWRIREVKENWKIERKEGKKWWKEMGKKGEREGWEEVCNDVCLNKEDGEMVEGWWEMKR